MTAEPVVTADQPVLQACALGLRLQGRPVVEQLSLAVQRQEMLGLIGPNGAGKSSLLRLLAGVLRPDAGQVLLHGQPLHKMGRRAIARELALAVSAAAFCRAGLGCRATGPGGSRHGGASPQRLAQPLGR